MIRRSVAFVLAAYALHVTIAIEKWAIAAGRWGYREAMPTIAGAGVSRLLQWLVVPAAIAALARMIRRRSIDLPRTASRRSD